MSGAADLGEGARRQGPLAEFARYRSTDGVSLNALLYEGRAEGDTAVVLVPGFWGSFVGNHDYRPIARRLNDQGHAFMAINMRTANDFTDPTLEHAVQDVGAAVALLKQRGYGRIALFGTSLGAPRSMLYLTQAEEPAIRLYGLIAPIMSPYEEAQLRMDEADRQRLDGFLAQLRTLVRDGRGHEPVLFEKWFSFRSVRMTARGFLNVFGTPEDTPVSVLLRAHQVRVPTAIFHGTADRVSLPPNAQRIHDALVAAPSRELFWVKDATHYLEPGWIADEYARQVSEWIDRRFKTTEETR